MKYNGEVKLVSVAGFHNLAPALGEVVPCIIQVFPDGDLLYHVSPDVLEKFGCIVGASLKAYPFFDSEVEEISRGDEV